MTADEKPRLVAVAKALHQLDVIHGITTGPWDVCQEPYLEDAAVLVAAYEEAES